MIRCALLGKEEGIRLDISMTAENIWPLKELRRKKQDFGRLLFIAKITENNHLDKRLGGFYIINL